MLESLTAIMMLSIGSLFVFLYRMDRNQRRKDAAADAERETPGISA